MGLGTITKKKTWLVTGGAGFIGSNFILAQSDPEITIINLNKLTYAGDLKNLAGIKNQNNYIFVHGSRLGTNFYAKFCFAGHMSLK